MTIRESYEEIIDYFNNTFNNFTIRQANIYAVKHTWDFHNSKLCVSDYINNNK